MDGIARKLNYLMDQKKVSHEILAAIMGISVSRMESYLSGTKNPNLELLARMALYLGVDLNYFSSIKFEEKDPMAPTTGVDERECLNIPCKKLHSSRRPSGEKQMQMNRVFMNDWECTQDNTVFVEVDTELNTDLFFKGDYILARRLTKPCEDNAIVLTLGKSCDVFRFASAAGKNLLVSLTDMSMKSVEDDGWGLYYTVVRIFHQLRSIEGHVLPESQLKN